LAFTMEWVIVPTLFIIKSSRDKLANQIIKAKDLSVHLSHFQTAEKGISNVKIRNSKCPFELVERGLIQKYYPNYMHNCTDY
jgi:hypothetical protein